MNKAVFLDRDGVINVDRHYVSKIVDFQFIDGIFDLLAYLQGLGYLLIIVTNQAGIARGFYTETDFRVLNEWMLDEFTERRIRITRVYYSPYHPQGCIETYQKDSFCRKPHPGMIFQAQQEFDIDLGSSILIGDQETDIEAGLNAGIKTNIIVNGFAKQQPLDTKANLAVESVKELELLWKGGSIKPDP